MKKPADESWKLAAMQRRPATPFQIARSLLLLVVMLACFYAGLFGGVEGALNIAMFYVWAIALPYGFLVLVVVGNDRGMLAKVAKLPKWARWRGVLDLVGLGMLLWAGFIGTGAAWLVSTFIASVYRAWLDEYDAAAAARQKTEAYAP